MKAQNVSWTTTIGYGAGDFGFNLYFAGLNLYLLYYYTDVLNIDPAIAGLIFMIPVIWDGVSDPLMGWLATRTRTKHGKFRPYILLGAPFMGLSFVGMFAAPVWFPEQVVLVSLVTHILFRTLYTVCSVPYSSLAAALTFDSQVRGTMAGVRMMAAMIGGVVTAATMLELASYFGDGDFRAGFVTVGMIYACLATVMMVIIFLTTTEQLHTAEQPHLTTQQTISFLRHNSAFWLLTGACFLGVLGSAIGGKALVYYINYYAGHPEAVSKILPLGILGAAVGIPIWTMVARRYSKRLVWIIGGSAAALGNLAIYVFEITDVSLLSATAVYSGLFGGAVSVMFWSMLPDTVEFGQWRSGVRDDAIVFGLSQFVSKAGSGIGVGLIGLLLSFIGYTANEVQTEETLQGIRATAFLVPVVAGLGAVAVMAYYPLDTITHQRIVRIITARARRRNRAQAPTRHLVSE